jgi:hypothetical protein
MIEINRIHDVKLKMNDIQPLKNLRNIIEIGHSLVIKLKRNIKTRLLDENTPCLNGRFPRQAVSSVKGRNKTLRRRNS